MGGKPKGELLFYFFNFKENLHSKEVQAVWGSSEHNSKCWVMISISENHPSCGSK